MDLFETLTDAQVDELYAYNGFWIDSFSREEKIRTMLSLMNAGVISLPSPSRYKEPGDLAIQLIREISARLDAETRVHDLQTQLDAANQQLGELKEMLMSLDVPQEKFKAPEKLIQVNNAKEFPFGV